MKTVEEYLKMLGLSVVDKVTGFEGTITSIGFDLYGCIQAILTPPVKKDGVKGDGYWFDIDRLKIIGKKPVMTQPDFVLCNPKQKSKSEIKGPQEKPVYK